jgi:prepilin-type N-terminal cleavage/methylation domain-containing protein
VIRRTRGEYGFTLLEVLVTLTVLAIGTALTLSLISGALGNIRKVQQRARTIQHAETVLELTLLDESILRPTSLTGDFEDGTRWAVRVEEMVMPPPPNQNPLQQIMLPVKLLSFSVEVFAPESMAPDFKLQTLKVVNVPQEERLIGMPR